MSKTIELSQNLVAIVDDSDYAELSQYKWHAARIGRSIHAYRHVAENGKRRKQAMHRMIMNAPEGMFVDHVNSNGLDCRRENMRLATVAQNTQNRRLDARNKSGISGVHFNKNNRAWKAQIGSEFIGYFRTFDDAVAARKSAEEKQHGEFASGVSDEKLMQVSRTNVITAKHGIDRRIAKNNVSGCNGVSWNDKKQLWQASLYAKGVRHHLGWHKTLETAVAARKAAETVHYATP